MGSGKNETLKQTYHLFYQELGFVDVQFYGGQMYHVALNLGFFGHATLLINIINACWLSDRPLPLHQISNMCLVDIFLFFISIKLFFSKIPHLPICNYDTGHNLRTLYLRYLKQQTLKGKKFYNNNGPINRTKLHKIVPFSFRTIEVFKGITKDGYVRFMFYVTV